MSETRLFVQVRLIEEQDLTPGKSKPYTVTRTLDRRKLVEVPDIASGEAWLTTLEDDIRHQVREMEK